MNHVERVFSQSDASRISGVPQDVLRDWRRRDLLGRIGEQSENGRWNYNLHDILLLATVRVLDGNGQPIPLLIFMAWHLVLSVIYELSPSEDNRAFARENTAFWFNETDGGMMGPVNVRSLDDLALIPSNRPQVIIVNSAKLANAMPAGVQMLLGRDN